MFIVGLASRPFVTGSGFCRVYVINQQGYSVAHCCGAGIHNVVESGKP